MTIDGYDRLLFLQNGVCAMCGKAERALLNGIIKRLAVDHNHETGKIRGLLCNHCHSLITRIENNPSFYERATKYLTIK